MERCQVNIFDASVDGRNMRNHYKIILAVLALMICMVVGAKTLFAATCTGADPCKACKNCKYCKHCAKLGGKCGVCK